MLEGAVHSFISADVEVKLRDAEGYPSITCFRCPLKDLLDCLRKDLFHITRVKRNNTNRANGKINATSMLR